MARGRFKKPKALTSRTPSVSLPVPDAAVEQFTEYLAAQFNRTTLFLRNKTAASVIGAIDAAYSAARTDNRGVTPGLGRFCIFCHQAMFSGASCIARGVPLDGAAASRRALEGARTALAIKLDAENGNRWIAYESRMERWKARVKNEKPPKLNLNYNVLNDDSMAKQLGRIIGVLSDEAVHFTPEFFSHLDVTEQNVGVKLFSQYLETDDGEIARHLWMFAAVHLQILRTLDRCADGGFSSASLFVSAMQDIEISALKLKRLP